MQTGVVVNRDLEQRWKELDTDKGTLITQAEEYSEWTLPYVFPKDPSKNLELQVSKDSIGAQGVNHLSNKVMSVLFPPQRMFFRLTIPEDMKQKIKAGLQQSGATPTEEQAQAALGAALINAETALASEEKKAQDYMDMVQYRPQGVTAAKLLIITGNALMFHPKNRPVQVYNFRDYCVVRDLSGEVIEIMTCEKKAFDTFAPAVQEQIKHVRTRTAKPYGIKDLVTIYTQIVLKEDGKFHVFQQADTVSLNTMNNFYTKDKLPWIPLTWNLVRGEDYGRGLVSEYAGAFHAVNTLTGSLLNMAAVMGDIKFMVKPSSALDVAHLNNSPSGSYHSGNPEDVAAVEVRKQHDAQFVQSMIERYERQIGQAFLLNSAITRNAERVTAEEIREQANELETSNGGIYSRLAAQWQQPTAYIVLDHIDYDGEVAGITPKIITGMDSLSRTGELDNMRMFMADIAMLNAVPEDVRARLKLGEFMTIIGTNRQVEYQKFVKSNEEVQAEQQMMLQQQAAMQQQQANAQGQVAASKEAVKG